MFYFILFYLFYFNDSNFFFFGFVLFQDRVSFLHKSVMEYLGARTMFDELLRLGTTISLEQLVTSPLNQKLLMSEPAVVRFLAEMITGRESHENKLMEIIKYSEKNKKVQ